MKKDNCKIHRIAITGGPCAGKTSLINVLENRGYNVVHEYARQIIEETPNLPLGRLEVKIFKRQLLIERNLMQLTFLDRGLPDIIAYSSLFLQMIPEEFRDFNFSNRYSQVFILDRLPHKNDAIRKETQEESARIHHKLIEIYKKLGYSPIHVPVLPTPEERADYIIKNI